MENPNAIKMDDRCIYSFSGKSYRRLSPRDRNHVKERRLPFVKRARAKGHTYHYFAGPNRAALVRLPDPSDPGFDNAYLRELAKLEGEAVPGCVAPSKSVVYFIGEPDGPLKIGTTIRLDRRLAALRAHNPRPLLVLATRSGHYDVEGEYHKRFAAHRLHGEWFAPHPDILAEIERVRKEGVR